jgi:primosomal protein N'
MKNLNTMLGILGIVRAKNFNCPVVLGSATPSFESIHNINIKKYKQYLLLNRFHKSKMPLLQLLIPQLINQMKDYQKFLRIK